jgi:bla regulator protein BlaR1
MSAQWMMYAVAVGLVITLAALAAEQGARLARRPGRWIWALAMVLTVALPLLTLGGAARQPWSSAHSDAPGSALSSAPTLVASGFPSTPSLTVPAWLPVQTFNTGGMDIDIYNMVRLAWPLCSALVLAALIGAGLALRRRQRHWHLGALAGISVLISVDAGPAVVGVLRPHIVVPAWLTTACASRQALVMAHEQAHIDAGDQRLLAAVALLLVAMPWNFPLWFQVRRLRLAVEVDCDARVLEKGHRMADYGAALIDIGSHKSCTPTSRLSPIAPAMAESSGFLEQRVRLMARRPARWHRVAAPLLLLLSLDIGAAAARIAPPQGAVAGAEVAVPQPLRQYLAGYYQLDANRVAVVSVTAEGLAMKTNVERLWRLLPESDDRYFVPGSDLRVRFDRAAGTLTLSQFGADAGPAPRVDGAAVEQADAYVAARVASQQPLAGGEAIVRRNVGAREVGELHAADFTPGFLRQARALMPRQRKLNETYGKVEDVIFDGVNRWGWDCYKVRYTKRTVTWAIWLDANGRLAAATFNNPPL